MTRRFLASRCRAPGWGIFYGLHTIISQLICSACRALQLSVFQKTEVSSPVEDDVVQQLDAYDFTSRFELGGDVDVAWRWLKAAAGVVVGHDDGGGAVAEGIGEDFAWMHGAAVNQAN